MLRLRSGPLRPGAFCPEGRAVKPHHVRVHAFRIHLMPAKLAGHGTGRLRDRLVLKRVAVALPPTLAFVPALPRFGRFRTSLAPCASAATS